MSSFFIDLFPNSYAELRDMVPALQLFNFGQDSDEDEVGINFEKKEESHHA